MILLATATPLSTLLGNFIIVTGSVVLLFVLLRLFAWEQLTAIMDQRANKIASDLDKAAASRQEAEQLAQEREEALRLARVEASRIVTEAKTLGQTQADRLVKEAKLDSQAMKEKARLDIEAERHKALAESRSEIAQISLEVAEKILGAELTESRQSALIDRYLDELGEL